MLRNGNELTRQVTPVSSPNSRFEIGEIGVLPDIHPVVPRVNPGEPAERAGIRPGDVIVAVDGARVTLPSHLTQIISKNPEKTVTITVEREGRRLDLPVTPSLGGCSGVAANIGCIGIALSEPTKSIQPGPLEAVRMSIDRNVQMTGLILETLWGLITLETSPKQLMGPVAIAQLSGESATLGLLALFSLMANISLNLGLLNLLPIPVLDGGHIAIMAIEGLARRDFSMRVKEKMLLAGFFVLMMLMVTAIYNDLTRITWIERLMPWR
jgi:regulator of sigma E protease